MIDRVLPRGRGSSRRVSHDEQRKRGRQEHPPQKKENNNLGFYQVLKIRSVKGAMNVMERHTRAQEEILAIFPMKALFFKRRKNP